jgi:hypothetical protein
VNFCSRTDLASHGPAAGTGVYAKAYVFLPVAKRLWRHSELNSGWASPETLRAIRAARAEGVVTRLYNPPRDTAAAAPALVYAAGEAAEPAALDGLLDVAAAGRPVDAAGAPRLAVCTHGTRDRCCAKWGFSVYKAARALFEAGASPFEPLECSHLGGDRFAATGIVFPSGSMYAHLDAADLQALLAGEAAGRLTAAHYRGRVFEPALTQVVRAGLARDGLIDEAAGPLVVTREDGANEVRVSARGGTLELLVSVASVDVTFFGSCHKLAEGRPSRGRRTVYVGARPLR